MTGATTGTRSCELSSSSTRSRPAATEQKGVRVFHGIIFFEYDLLDIQRKVSCVSTKSGGRRSSPAERTQAALGAARCEPPTTRSNGAAARQGQLRGCTARAVPGEATSGLVRLYPHADAARRPAARNRAAIPRTRFGPCTTPATRPGRGPGHRRSCTQSRFGICATSRMYPQCELPRRPRQHDSQRYSATCVLPVFIRQFR